MANWIDYILDVLAGNPAEIDQISERLNKPSRELATWVASEVKNTWMRSKTSFSNYSRSRPTKTSAFCIARSTKLGGSAWHSRSIMASSTVIWLKSPKPFPGHIPTIEYYDMQWSYPGKRVMSAGQIVREIHDGNQQAQAMGWVLVDIFAPFKAEYELGVSLGSCGSNGSLTSGSPSMS